MARPDSPVPVAIDRTAGVIRLYDPRIFGPAAALQCERFLRRAFAVEGINSVAIDTQEGRAVIQADRERFDSIALSLIGAVRGEGAELAPASLPPGAKGRRYRVERIGRRLTSWQVREDRPGQIRLRHEILRIDRVKARRAERLLSLVPGVGSATVSRFSTSLLVEYHPGLVNRDLLIQLADTALADQDFLPQDITASAAPGTTTANVNLGVAALADLGVAPFGPIAAVLLVGTNLRTFAEAGSQIRRKKVGLPVVYTSIVVGALANAQFLACAIMMWMYGYWKRRELDEVSTERQLLIEAHVAQPRLVRTNPGGRETPVPCGQLRQGDRVVVKSGDIVPADGRVVAGTGVVDERSITGVDGAARKRPGGSALAGSVVLFGQFQVEVERLHEATRAAAIRRAVAGAIAPAVNKFEQADRDHVAERAVGPTLATAGLGLAVGDLNTAAAILAPDYATGPTLATSLLSIADVSQCLARGIVVREPRALDRLAQSDVLVVTDCPGLERLELRVSAIDNRSSAVDGLIQLAASVGRHWEGERGRALTAAAFARDLPLLNLTPIDLNGGIAVRYGQRFVRLRDAEEESDYGPLSIEIDGGHAATIHFAESDELSAARHLERLRRDRGLRVILATQRAEPDAALLARRLGADEYCAGLVNGSLVEYLRKWRSRGQRVAVVGADRKVMEAAGDAHVTIGMVEDGDIDACHSPLNLLGPSLCRLVDVWDIATARLARARETQRFTVIPNLFCVAGAFFLGFTSLAAVIVSNLGTFGSFSVAAEQLRRSHRLGRKWHLPPSLVSRG
jgi:cation transport ATPase